MSVLFILGLILLAIPVSILLIAFTPILLVAVSFIAMAYVFTGWFFAILAFIFSGVPLGLTLLIIWLVLLLL